VDTRKLLFAQVAKRELFLHARSPRVFRGCPVLHQQLCVRKILLAQTAEQALVVMGLIRFHRLLPRRSPKMFVSLGVVARRRGGRISVAHWYRVVVSAALPLFLFPTRGAFAGARQKVRRQRGNPIRGAVALVGQNNAICGGRRSCRQGSIGSRNKMARRCEPFAEHVTRFDGTRLVAGFFARLFVAGVVAG
jgi:hypothetical protein